MTPLADELDTRIRAHLHNTCVVPADKAEPRHLYQALAHAVRDRLVDRWHDTQATYARTGAKQIHYLSAEFLLGRALTQNLLALGLYEPAREAFAARGLDLAEVLEQEPDPGLGNGGLGRLAACFLESMATLGLPGFGQGIRYEYGIFEQRIVDGEQVEHGDDWLRYGNVWEVARPDERVPVRFYGHVAHHVDEDGSFSVSWENTRQVWGVPYDMPIAGYDTEHVNTLRLWSAEPTDGFDLSVFNAGDYRRAVEERTLVEAISKVLYPADHTPEGRELRLKQQVFFCTCAIADILRRYEADHDDLSGLPDAVAIQLNDTHPAVTVAELMRALLDERGLSWDQAWAITNGVVAYTNHTLMPEALETWPVSMFAHLLPRHFEIIREIDRRFVEQVAARWPDEPGKIHTMRIITEDHDPRIRMAHLATVGAHTVNGVAALHSELIKSHLLPEFAAFYPDRFQNKTNGVTPRRWIRGCNPGLSDLLDGLVGPRWTSDLARVEGLLDHIDDAAVREQIAGIKLQNKERLANRLHQVLDRRFDPSALFDIQIKRIHEYKRQLLAGLQVLARAERLRDGEDLPPRVVLFGGKAAPGYVMAKHHIRFLCDVARFIDADARVAERLQMAFVPDYNVSLAEILIPGADLSEQISMAGKEASGTGNMKFAMNGALTIGTLDGANIEIRDAVGDENFFLFGHTAAEVRALKPHYEPSRFIADSPLLERVLTLVEEGALSPGDPGRYRDLVAELRHVDTWLVCADFDDYIRAQDRVDAAWGRPDAWVRSAMHNIARVHGFSSDRTISQYAADIWKVERTEIERGEHR